MIQSRGPQEANWRDEVCRRTRFEAFMAARTKARVTGRVYRLVDRDGLVLEVVYGRQEGPVQAPMPNQQESG